MVHVGIHIPFVPWMVWEIHNHLSSVSMEVQWGLRIGSVDLLGLRQIFLRKKLFRKSWPQDVSYHLPTIQFSDMLVFRDCISVLFDGKNTYSFVLAKIFVRSSFLFETAATCTLFINWDAGCKGPVAPLPLQSRLDPGNHLKNRLSGNLNKKYIMFIWCESILLESISNNWTVK